MRESITERLEGLVRFVSGTRADPEILRAVETVGAELAVVALQELVHWLGRQPNTKAAKVLALRDKHKWSVCLPHLIELLPVLSELLVVEGGTVRYRDNVARATRRAVRDLVARHYRPPLFTTPKPSRRE